MPTKKELEEESKSLQAAYDLAVEIAGPGATQEQIIKCGMVLASANIAAYIGSHIADHTLEENLGWLVEYLETLADHYPDWIKVERYIHTQRNTKTPPKPQQH